MIKHESWTSLYWLREYLQKGGKVHFTPEGVSYKEVQRRFERYLNEDHKSTRS